MKQIKQEKDSYVLSYLLIFVLAVLRKKKLIGILTLILCSIFIIIVFFYKMIPLGLGIEILPDYYEPKAWISIRDSMSSIIDPDAASQDIMNLLMSGNNEGRNTNIYIANIIFYGNILADRIIDEFDFVKVYKINNKDPYKAKTDAREIYHKNLFISGSRNDLSALFSVSYRAKNSNFATNVLKRTLVLFEQRLKEILVGQVSMRKANIDEMLKKSEQNKKFREDDLVRFRHENGIIDPSHVVQPQIDQLGDLNAELIREEIELQNLLNYLLEDSPKIVILKNKIDTTKEFINEIRNGFPDMSSKITLPGKSSDLSMKFLNLQSDFEIQNRIYQMLREQDEQLKINENDNVNVFQIIEPPTYLKLVSGPDRPFYIIVGCFAFFLLSISVALLVDYIQNILKNKKESDKWAWIMSVIKLKVKSRQ
jgi:hypothetical protein